MNTIPGHLKNPALPPVIYGTMALFLGVGLARFSYSSVIPLLVRDEWYTASQAQMLGALCLVGYLLGCFSAQTLSRLASPATLIGWLALSVVISFAVCSYPVSFPVAAFWRLLAGFSGAGLMIVCVAFVTATLNQTGHGQAAGFVFLGVGAGAVVASVFLPILSAYSVAVISLVLAGFSVAAYALLLICGQRMPRATTWVSPSPHAPSSRSGNRTIFWIIGAYACDGLGGTPVTVYFVDYIVRELGDSYLWSSLAWSAFGIGAMLGPLLMMRRSSRWLPASLFLKAVTLTLAVCLPLPVLYVFAAFVAGFFTPGLAIQVAAVIRQLATDASVFQRNWAHATTSFAVAQAASGLLASALSQALMSYRPVFLTSAGLLLLGMVMAWIGGRRLAATGAS